MDVQMFKQYAVIEHDADDALIRVLLDAAKEHLRGAGVPPTRSKLYDVACYMIAHDWYDRRGAEPVGSPLDKNVEHALNGIIWKLKLGAVPGTAGGRPKGGRGHA